MMRKTIITFLAFGLFAVASFAQFGANDATFNPRSGFNDKVNSISIQADGKIIVGGQFTAFNGTQRNSIARLNADGSLDTTFDTGIGFYDGISTTVIFSTSIQADGKIIVGGGFSSFNGIPRKCIARLNEDGFLDTTFNPGSGFDYYVTSTSIQSDGKIIVGGSFMFFNGMPVYQIARLNSDGSLDTTFDTGLGFWSDGVFSTSIQADGKIIVGGGFNEFNNIPISGIARLNTDGSLDTTFDPRFNVNDWVFSTSIQADGKIIVGATWWSSLDGPLRNRIARLNADGSLDTSFDPGSGFNNTVRSTSIQTDGKIIVGGSFTSFNGMPRNGIARLHANGTLDPSFDPGTGFNEAVRSISIQSDGKIIVGGDFTSYNGTPRNNITRLSGDYCACSYGQVYLDLNQDCAKDSGETGLAGRIITVQPGNYITQTTNSGYWKIDSLPAGNYTATIDTSNSNWITTCPISQSFTVVHPDSATYAPNFGIVAAYPCPIPDISIIMPWMRRGFSNPVYVYACNTNAGSEALDSAYAIINLDANITVQSGSLPYTDLGNNQYRVKLGNINPGQCVNFSFNTTVGLGAVANQTLCLSAELFPQPKCVFDSTPKPFPLGTVNPCNLPWDGSSLKVKGACTGDSVRFVVNNTGQFGNGNMQCFSPIKVYLDGQWKLLDSVKLVGGDSAVFTFPGDGQTWRLETDQHPLHPGNSFPNASIENCGSGTWKPGLISILPQDDADPFIDIFCGQVSAPYDPNDKTGFPLGVGSDNAIRQNQRIEYLIRFQNIGTDTAFNVVIRDTLADELNIFTVQSGVSSFPYEFRMYGQRVLEWTFQNIMLPDSNTDEQGSQGFVKFSVEQNPNLPFGTIIENTAAIYFDFEDPVITNTYQHMVSHFAAPIVSNISSPKLQPLQLKIMPNPMLQTALVEIDGLNDVSDLSLELFNPSGQRLQMLPTTQQEGQFQLQREGLPAGVYFIVVKQRGQLLAWGKVMLL